MNLIEKTAYIKGLADGLDLDKTTKEGKLIAALLEVVDVMAKRIETLEDAVDELNEYIEEVDEDLGDVEEYLYDEEDEYECDGNCDECDECETCDECDCCDGCDCEDDEYYEIECPSCGEIIYFDDDIDPEDLTCPACHEKIACLVDEDDLSLVEGEDK
jgi:hypothetical protein